MKFPICGKLKFMFQSPTTRTFRSLMQTEANSRDNRHLQLQPRWSFVLVRFPAWVAATVAPAFPTQAPLISRWRAVTCAGALDLPPNLTGPDESFTLALIALMEERCRPGQTKTRSKDRFKNLAHPIQSPHHFTHYIHHTHFYVYI